MPDATSSPTHPIVVVGIGEDGWDGLSAYAQRALTDADVVLGSARQLALVGERAQACREWPSPLPPALRTLRDDHPGQRIAVLASGDPMFHGVGASLARIHGADAVLVLPAPSSVSLACARLGWARADVEVISLVGHPMANVVRLLQPGRQLLILVGSEQAAAQVSQLATEHGFADAPMHVLAHLGGPQESHEQFTAAQWGSREHPRLAVLALDTRGLAGGCAFALTPGLSDAAWATDGVLTKREVRAITLAALAPMPRELLWDIGAGSGSVAVEWMRSHPSCRAIAIEPRADRRAFIELNRDRFGVPGLSVIAGMAPEALEGLERPDAIFLGGGLTSDGVVEAARAALRPGGRLVANGVTLESEAILIELHGRLGGELTRIAISHTRGLGGFTAMRPALPLTQWRWCRP